MDLLNPSYDDSDFCDVFTSQNNEFSFEQPKLIQIDENTPVSVSTLDSLPLCDRAVHKISKKSNKKKYDFHTKKRKKNHKKNELLNNEVFSFTEDYKILNLVLKLGPRFQLIAKDFPDRSLNAVKNRYYKYLRYRWDDILGSHYQHMNHQLESQQQQNDSLLEFVGQMNLFPEVTYILQKFVSKINDNFM